jgi:hypothetical protein
MNKDRIIGAAGRRPATSSKQQAKVVGDQKRDGKTEAVEGKAQNAVGRIGRSLTEPARK